MTSFNKVHFLVLIICCGLSCCQTIDATDQELCLPLRQSSTIIQPSPSQQGRPGKVGPVGPPGPKGNIGEPGACVCNPSEIDRLNNRIQVLTQDLQEQINLTKSLIPARSYIESCSVGFKSGRVKNSDITASSIHPATVEAHQGRLDNRGNNQRTGSWSALRNSVGQWIQVDLRRPTSVTGVITQGRFDSDQWVTSYKISYSDNESSFQYISDENGRDVVFQGNRDRNTYVMNRFPQPVVARYFRLVAQTWRDHISLRLEYITC